MTKSKISKKIHDPKRGLLRLADLTKRLFSIPKEEYEREERKWKQRKNIGEMKES